LSHVGGGIIVDGVVISEIALLNLQEAYSRSVLMYAYSALSLHTNQIAELNACWNNVIRRIFGYHRWESVKAVIYGLGRLNVTYEFLLRRIKFYKRLFFKSGFMHNIFWAALLSDNSDDCMSAVFIPLDKATENVYLRFYKYVYD